MNADARKVAAELLPCIRKRFLDSCQNEIHVYLDSHATRAFWAAISSKLEDWASLNQNEGLIAASPSKPSRMTQPSRFEPIVADSSPMLIWITGPRLADFT